MPITKGSSLTILGNYNPDLVKCFVKNGDAIKNIDFTLSENAITIPLDDIDSFIINAGKSVSSETNSPTNDLTWLWILLGVVGGVIVLGAIAFVIFYILTKKGKKDDSENNK